MAALWSSCLVVPWLLLCGHSPFLFCGSQELRESWVSTPVQPVTFQGEDIPRSHVIYTQPRSTSSTGLKGWHCQAGDLVMEHHQLPSCLHLGRGKQVVCLTWVLWIQGVSVIVQVDCLESYTGSPPGIHSFNPPKRNVFAKNFYFIIPQMNDTA